MCCTLKCSLMGAIQTVFWGINLLVGSLRARPRSRTEPGLGVHVRVSGLILLMSALRASALFLILVSLIYLQAEGNMWKIKSKYKMDALDEQFLPVRWMSLNKVSSKWAEDSRLQSLHQLSFVNQQLFPFGLHEVSLPWILVQTIIRSSSDYIYAFTKITRDPFVRLQLSRPEKRIYIEIQI